MKLCWNFVYYQKESCPGSGRYLAGYSDPVKLTSEMVITAFRRPHVGGLVLVLTHILKGELAVPLLRLD